MRLSGTSRKIPGRRDPALWPLGLLLAIVLECGVGSNEGLAENCNACLL